MLEGDAVPAGRSVEGSGFDMLCFSEFSCNSGGEARGGALELEHVPRAFESQ